MQYLNQALYEKLISVSGLTGGSGKLAVNAHWTGEGSPSRNNSVLHVRNLNGTQKPIFIVFSIGAVPELGKSRVAQVFIRIYDKTGLGSGFNIVTVKEIVRNALNDVQIKITRDGKVYVYHLYATLEQPEREDEALNLNFIELEFDCYIA